MKIDLKLGWNGLVVKLRVKKDISTLKLLKLNLNLNKDEDFSLVCELDDF